MHVAASGLLFAACLIAQQATLGCCSQEYHDAAVNSDVNKLPLILLDVDGVVNRVPRSAFEQSSWNDEIVFRDSDVSRFEITADNKINELSNKQKPKNIIDFIQKEANLTSEEAIEIAYTLHEKIGSEFVKDSVKNYEKIKSKQEKKEEKINENLDIIELEKARKNRDRER